MPQIVAVRAKDDSSRDNIVVVLSQDAVCLGPDGQPWSGVSLTAELARSLAERLLSLAREVECQKQREPQDSVRSLVQVNSILVVHDGSEQGHRAFALALDLASRSLASIRLLGWYGARQDTFELSNVPEDSQWRRGWLQRLIEMYSVEAQKAGVELDGEVISASDQPALSVILEAGRFDLIVLPRSFADNNLSGDTTTLLRQSLSAAMGSTILFCP